MGKIVVIKNFALPKLIYPLTSLPNPPSDTVQRLEIIMFNFIWDGKPDKIKRDILIQDYEQGGLKMISKQNFILSLKEVGLSVYYSQNATSSLGVFMKGI